MSRRMASPLLIMILVFALNPSDLGEDGSSLERGLVGYWSFDEGEGDIAFDSTNNEYAGSLYGQPSWVAGKFDGALRFDGSGDWINIRFDPATSLPDGSVSFWEAPGFSSSEQDSWKGLVVLYNDRNELFEFSHGWAGNPRRPYSWLVWRSSGVGYHINVIGPIFKSDQWHHWVGTWRGLDSDTLEMTFYLNGELVGTRILEVEGGITRSNFLRVEIARFGSSHYFNGIIDDIRIYNRVLSTEEVEEFFQKGNTPGSVALGSQSAW